MKTLITAIKLPHIITTAAFAALALSCAAATIAAEPSDVPQVVVKFGDLNLSNPLGAAVLYNRIAAAAQQVCRGFGDTGSRDLGSRARLHACVHTAIGDAVGKVGQAELFTIYNAKNREHLPILVAIAQNR